MPYVNKRWLGGMLTNFVTIKKRIGLLDQLEARQQAGDFDRLPKKEAAKLTEELTKLQRTLGGIRKMKRLPGAIFIVDPHRERIARDRGATSSRSRSSARATRTSTRTSSTTSSRPTTTRSARSGCCARSSPTPRSRARRSAPPARRPSPSRSRRWRCPSPRTRPGATDELVAALAGGAALTFEPDADDDDLLPGDRAPVPRPPSPRPPPEATPEEIAAELAREAAEKAEDDPAATPAG